VLTERIPPNRIGVFPAVLRHPQTDGFVGIETAIQGFGVAPRAENENPFAQVGGNEGFVRASGRALRRRRDRKNGLSGVLAPASKWRPRTVPEPPPPAAAIPSTIPPGTARRQEIHKDVLNNIFRILHAMRDVIKRSAVVSFKYMARWLGKNLPTKKTIAQKLDGSCVLKTDRQNLTADEIRHAAYLSCA
jgi:hypothetical protein